MFDKLMVSRSWWGEGTKSFSKDPFVVKGSKWQNSRKGTAMANTYAFAGTSLFPTLASVHFGTRTIIIHTSHRLRTAQTPFPPSMAGLTPSFGCRHPRGTRDRWRHYHGHGVKLWLPARLYRATIHSALRAEFQQPRKAGTRCDGARSRATADSPMLRYRPN